MRKVNELGKAKLNKYVGDAEQDKRDKAVDFRKKKSNDMAKFDRERKMRNRTIGIRQAKKRLGSLKENTQIDYDLLEEEYEEAQQKAQTVINELTHIVGKLQNFVESSPRRLVQSDQPFVGFGLMNVHANTAYKELMAFGEVFNALEEMYNDYNEQHRKRFVREVKELDLMDSDQFNLAKEILSEDPELLRSLQKPNNNS